VRAAGAVLPRPRADPVDHADHADHDAPRRRTTMQDLVNQIAAALRGMWKFRWPGLIAAWIVAVLAVVVVWRIPDQYEATARIYVDTDSILKPLMSGLAVQANVEQQISMLSRTLISRPNLEKLIRMADLDLKNQSKADQEALVERLQKDIKLQAAGGLNLYSMSYRDTEPEKAKRVMQSLVSIFVESGLGASRKDTDSAKTFLAEQIKQFEAKLEESEARMKEFRLRNIEASGADGRDAATRVAELTQQFQQAQLLLREAENARDAAKKQIEDEKVNGNIAASAALMQDPGVTVATPDLDARIEALKRNLDLLLQRFTEQHPDVVTTRRLVKDLEDQRRREVAELQRAANARPAQTGGNQTASLALQELNRILATSEIQVAALRARVNEYGGRLAMARSSLKTAPQLEAEAAQLNRDYEVTKKNYQDLVARRQAAVMSGELDVASGVADFRLIDPPRVSPKAVAPNRLVLFPLAFLVALCAGAAFAFAASQLRPTFGHPDDMRAGTGLPLLGVVSAVVSDVERRRERASMFRFVAAFGSLVGLFAAGMIALVALNRYGA
jgi:polysaccharide chain length determinant protein (PEP-CTERM system associated)